MAPELWVTLIVGLATPISAIVVEVIRRRRRNDTPPSEDKPVDADSPR